MKLLSGHIPFQPRIIWVNMENKSTPAGNDNTGLGISEIRYDLQILQSIRRIIRAIDVQSKRLKSDYNITTPQLVCLTVIVEKGPITATLLSKEIHLSTSTLVGIIDRLEAADMVQKSRSKTDRRVVFIQASAKGKKLIKKVPSPLQKGFIIALNSLEVHEQASILAALLKVVNLLEAEHIEAAPLLETGIIIPQEQVKKDIT